MADIAFLLLIFFLVATTMNVDTGLVRMLPPMLLTGIDNSFVYCIIKHVIIHFVGIRTGDCHTGKPNILQIDNALLCLFYRVSFLAVNNQTDRISHSYRIEAIQTAGTADLHR